MPLRALLARTSLCLALLSGGASGATLSLDEARGIAQSALVAGQPEITLQIVAELLRANPRDTHALLMASVANRDLGEHTYGRRAARLAFRSAETQNQKFQAAQLAAQTALAEDRPTLSQIWLRRAAQNAKSDEESAAIARAYSRVRAFNPWSFHVDLSIRPSSNVNNGAEDEVQTIDGVPGVEGLLSPEAQALSGTIGTLTLSANYRLTASDTSRTTIGTRTQIRRVALSAEAKEDAPDASSRDFGYTYADLSLDHVIALGETRGNVLRLTGTAGALWVPDDVEYTFARLSAERVWRTEAGHRLSAGASAATYNRDGDVQDSDSFGLTGSYSKTLENGDSIGLSLSYDAAVSDFANRESDTYTLRLRYGFAKAWGPAEASAALTLVHAEYPRYQVGFIEVPGGRADTSAYADLSLFFPDIDYAGFAPKVTFRAGHKSSNVSRFETREFSVMVGLQSKF